MTPHFHYYPSPEIKVKKVEPPKEKIVLTEKDWKELDKDCDKYHEEKDNDY